MTVGNVVTGSVCDLEPGNSHLILVGCHHCLARWVSRMTLEEVERWYHSGHVPQALYEAYCHCWATGAPRFSTAWDAWKVTPADPEVIALITLIKESPR